MLSRSKFLITLIVVLLFTTILFGVTFAEQLRFAHTDPPGGTREEAALFFAEKVKEYTEGRYTVKTFPSAILGNDVKLLELVSIGGVDFVVSGPVIYGKHIDAMSLLIFPYLIDTFEQGWHLYDDTNWVRTRFKELESKGFKMLATWEAGFRVLTTRMPVKKPSDVKGIKLRVPPNPIHLTIWKTFGANPVSMGIKEVYMAIQQGVVDGQENPIPTIWANKFYEVAKYVTLTNHNYGPIPLSISMKTWQKISAKDQQAIMKAAKEASAYSRKLVTEQQDQMIKDMEKAGAIIYRPNLTEWYNAVLPAYEKFKKDYGEELVESLMKEAQEIKNKYPAK